MISCVAESIELNARKDSINLKMISPAEELSRNCVRGFLYLCHAQKPSPLPDMKRTLLLIFSIILCACTSVDKFPDHAGKVVSEIHNPDSKYVIVACHRGDWRNYPENSIPAIESVIGMGADIVELDVKMTKDSVLVLCHDKTIDRTTDGKGRVSDITYDSLMTFRLKRAHGVVTDSLRMPTLKEALSVCKDRICVNVDQGFEFYDLVLEITEELGMTDQVLIKGKWSAKDVDEKFSHYDHNMMYMPIIDILKPQGAALFREYEENKIVPLAYELCWDKITPEVEECAEKIVSQGSKLWVNSLWGSLCGNLDDDAALEKGADEIYGQILDLGATMIQTDRPELLLDYLRRQGRR